MSVATQRGTSRKLVLALAPLVVLALVVIAFVQTDPLSGLRGDVPPVEELTVTGTRLTTDPHGIELAVTNGGPDPVTLAQVLVDDAYWQFESSEGNTFDRLARSTITIPYPWIEGEAHHIVLITSTGVTFDHEIGVAMETPRTTARTLWTFTLVGLFVGVIPVALGLTWLPFLSGLGQRWIDFFLSLTAGLLVFLGVDALEHAFEISGDVPGAFQGLGLIVLGVVGVLVTLSVVDGVLRRRRGGDLSRLYVAGLIALGIGLHNLGEGLAIGAAFSIGEVGLTTFLIVGFMVHNITEGLGIVSPLARSRPTIGSLVWLGALAGVPTIIGAWSGGLAYSPVLAVLFLAIGAGAIVQVVWEIGKLLQRSGRIGEPLNALGFAAGVALMYLTGLFVAA